MLDVRGLQLSAGARKRVPFKEGSSSRTMQDSASSSPKVRVCYQERARVEKASGDGLGRPPKSKIDRREVRPHVCTWRAGARVRTCTCLGVAREAAVEPFSWAITVDTVAPVYSVAESEDTLIVTPALDGRVVLR